MLPSLPACSGPMGHHLLAPLLAMLFLMGVVAPARALDCPAVHLLPHLEGGKVLLEGYVNRGKPRPGTRRRDRVRGLLANPAASAPVVLQVGPASLPVTLDGEGAFAITVPAWTGTATLAVLDPTTTPATTLWTRELALPPAPRFLLVSDIDDTIQVTEVTRRARMVFNSLFRKAENREAVPGTPETYRFLAAGAHSLGHPLVVYLSCSPAAMARSLEAFLDHHGFPAGVLCIKHTLTSDGTNPAVHKLKWLRRLAATYPGLPFLLLGDSGERDPEIYLEFARSAAPGMVKAIVIRQVPGREGKDRPRLEALAAALPPSGPPFLLWSNPDELTAALTTLGLQKQ